MENPLTDHLPVSSHHVERRTPNGAYRLGPAVAGTKRRRARIAADARPSGTRVQYAVTPLRGVRYAMADAAFGCRFDGFQSPIDRDDSTHDGLDQSSPSGVTLALRMTTA